MRLNNILLLGNRSSVNQIRIADKYNSVCIELILPPAHHLNNDSYISKESPLTQKQLNNLTSRIRRTKRSHRIIDLFPCLQSVNSERNFSATNHPSNGITLHFIIAFICTNFFASSFQIVVYLTRKYDVTNYCIE